MFRITAKHGGIWDKNKKKLSRTFEIADKYKAEYYKKAGYAIEEIAEPVVNEEAKPKKKKS